MGVGIRYAVGVVDICDGFCDVYFVRKNRNANIGSIREIAFILIFFLDVRGIKLQLLLVLLKFKCKFPYLQVF